MDKEDIRIELEHIESDSNQKISNDLKQYLQEQKDRGILDFEVKTRRKCDYCNKTLTNKDKFTTIRNGDEILDKCEDCEG